VVLDVIGQLLISLIFYVTSIIDQVFCIHQILEKKWEYTSIIHQPFIDFKKAYDSVKRESIVKHSH
jgi:hypothetical protein